MKRIAGLGVAGIGFILSPLSWWNDIVVNIPLALLLASVTSKLIHVGLDLLFAIYYWMTNVVGLALMFVGGSISVGSGVDRRSIVMGILASTIYTLLVVAGIKLL